MTRSSPQSKVICVGLLVLSGVLAGCNGGLPECSSKMATQTVIENLHKKLENAPNSAMVFDLAKTTYDVYAIRTRGTQDGVRYCSGLQSAHLAVTPLGFLSMHRDSLDGKDEPIEYNLSRTDDGKVLVDITKD